MTSIAHAIPSPLADVVESGALTGTITPRFAALVDWDPAVGIITFPLDHPTLGWNGCVVQGCAKPRSTRQRLCPGCLLRWKRGGQPDLDAFLNTTIHSSRLGRRPCMVAGCARPWTGPKNALCQAHHRQRARLGLTLEQFHAHPDVVGHPSAGPCQVASCTRDRMGRGRYCSAHDLALRKAQATDPDLEPERWRQIAAPVSEDHRLSLRGLPERVVWELLYTLQRRSSAGLKSRVAAARPLLNHVRRREVGSLADLAAEELSKPCRTLRNHVLAAVEELESDPQIGWARNRWSLTPMGHGGTLRFGEISQLWLREATKRGALEELPKRRGSWVAASLQAQINAITELSGSLHRHRDDHGRDPRLLGRADVVDFLNRMAYLQQSGQLSGYARIRCTYDAKRMLRRMRALGLTRPGQPLHGLPEDVTLTREDMPALPARDGPGRDLPAEVVATLTARLDELAGPGQFESRTAIGLLIDTGRRPGEICPLAWDCLHRDRDGKPVLIYDNYKALRLGRRLPISEFTASTIADQQDRVRARFPNTPTRQLVLLPATTRNPEGRRPISHGWLAERHRRWVDAGPELTAAVPISVEGRTVTRTTAFGKDRVFLYAWRHTYAQRHADAGVPIDVLRDLMDHADTRTTQGYYRVGETRRRTAIDQVTRMQFDRHGQRIWRQASALLDSEHTRRAVGEVAVPYGVCTEPVNVAAGGQDCPVRYRCVGCDHFRTDISYLPDLETYLAELLRTRERLLAAVDRLDADDWATAQAIPTTEEIQRVRTLIARIKADLDDTHPDRRAEIQQAVATVRRARAGVVNLGLPTTRPVPANPREHVS